MSTGELAGRLRERVTIQRRNPARDAVAGAAGEWVEIGTAWAEIVPTAHAAQVSGDALAAMPCWRVTLRAPGAAIAIDDRMVWHGRMLRVRAIHADPRTPDRITLHMEEQR